MLLSAQLAIGVLGQLPIVEGFPETWKQTRRWGLSTAPAHSGLLFQILKQNNTRLESRTQLVTMCHMGPKVFMNCAGFLKIDTASLGDR